MNVYQQSKLSVEALGSWHSNPGSTPFLAGTRLEIQRSHISDLNVGQMWAAIRTEEELDLIPNAKYVQVVENQAIGLNGYLPWDQCMKSLAQGIEQLPAYLAKHQAPPKFFDLPEGVQDVIFPITDLEYFPEPVGDYDGPLLDLTDEDKMALAAYWTTGVALQTGPETGYIVVEAKGDRLQETRQWLGSALYNTVCWSPTGSDLTTDHLYALFRAPRDYREKLLGYTVCDPASEDYQLVWYENGHVRMPPSFEVGAPQNQHRWINRPSVTPIAAAPAILLQFMANMYEVN